MAFPGIESFKTSFSNAKKIEIMTTAESILIQDVHSQLSDKGSVLLIKNGAGKNTMSIARKHVISIRFLHDLTSMV